MTPDRHQIQAAVVAGPRRRSTVVEGGPYTSHIERFLGTRAVLEWDRWCFGEELVGDSNTGSGARGCQRHDRLRSW